MFLDQRNEKFLLMEEKQADNEPSSIQQSATEITLPQNETEDTI